MKYQITYTTDARPTDLPDGATVEEIPTLPLRFDAADPFGRSFHLDGSAHTDDVAFFCIEGKGKHLTREQTIAVRDALNELLGEDKDVQVDTAPEWDGHSEPPADVVETKDRDGDHWFRCANGGWAAYSTSETGDRWHNPHGGFPAKYGPHTIVRRK